MADEGGGEAPKKEKKEKKEPAGAPAWMATYSDMVTLLLTFFVLLLSFAKTESNKYEAALGSIRNAFGGNVLVHGKVIQRGKSPDDSPSMLESQQPLRPFPIEFLTMEGLLDKHEVNRESDEDLRRMHQNLKSYNLGPLVNIETENEGIKVRMKEFIYFEKGRVSVSKMSVESFERMVKLLRENNWTVFVEGHASLGERGKNGQDSYELSSDRAIAVTKILIKKGVRPGKISTVFYGDTRSDKAFATDKRGPPHLDRRVEFMIRKRDLRTSGKKIYSK